MATKLFEDIIFGPIISRRLGISLGVNLLPVDGKLCNFNCCYCECGWTLSMAGLKFNDKEVVLSELEQRLEKIERLDIITFAGNGEPTMHPDFAEIIDRTLALRDRLAPKAKVAVLSNATMLSKESVREALAKVDRAMLKIDSATEQGVKLMNDPRFNYSIESVVEAMKLYEGELIIQTMLLRGYVEGGYIDSTSEQEISAYLKVIEELQPKEVVLYTIDRDTPAEALEQLTNEQMNIVAERVRALGIECSVTEVKNH